MRIFTKEDLETEVWEDLIGFETYFQISTLGRFKRKCRKGLKELILTLGYYSNGYEQFSVRINSVRYTAIAHRLVAKQFIPNTENKEEVNHKNGIRDDNRKVNLEWNTTSENMFHSFRELGRQPKNNTGIKNPKVILTEKQVLEIRRLHKEEGIGNYELAKIYNMKPPAIWKILHNYTWKHI